MQETKRIRVLQLGSPTGLYGAERWILALIKCLDCEKIESVVAVIKDDPRLDASICREAERMGIRTQVFEAYGRVNLSAVRQLRKFIVEEGIHILHTHGYKTDIIGLLAVQGTGCRIVSTPHGWSTKAGLKVQIYEILDRLAFLFVDAVTPLSKDLFDHLKAFPRMSRRIHLILNGVDLDEVRSVTGINSEVQRWKESGHFVVGYIGQLIQRKGLDILLKAIAKLDWSHLRVAIVGEGDERESLERMAGSLKIKDRVRFFGFREDRIQVLKGLDVFVLASRMEGIPRCVMEAMAARVPVVASDTPGCLDLIHDEDTGLIFRRDDVDSLAERLKRMLLDETARERIKENASDFINRKYSAGSMANRYEALYQSLILG
jgi:glycosyltransferase involved in cell wall biosynthesis